MSITEGELSAARRAYVPANHGGRSFDEMITQTPAALAPLIATVRVRAEAVDEELDWLEACSTIPAPVGDIPDPPAEMPAHLAAPDPHGQYPLIVNTDANPGRTIFIGSIDPAGIYALVDGDVWIDTSA